jgi:hypothetical protein
MSINATRWSSFQLTFQDPLHNSQTQTEVMGQVRNRVRNRIINHSNAFVDLVIQNGESGHTPGVKQETSVLNNLTGQSQFAWVAQETYFHHIIHSCCQCLCALKQRRLMDQKVITMGPDQSGGEIVNTHQDCTMAQMWVKRVLPQKGLPPGLAKELSLEANGDISKLSSQDGRGSQTHWQRTIWPVQGWRVPRNFWSSFCTVN